MKLAAGDTYAVLAGDYVGEMWCFIERKENTLCFLSFPNMLTREAPFDRFQFGVANKIAEKVKKLPKEVFEVVKAQYAKNSNH